MWSDYRKSSVVSDQVPMIATENLVATVDA